MAKQTAAVNPVTLNDGTVVDFGKNGQIKRTVTAGIGSFTLELALITGKQLTVTVDNANTAYDTLAARGAAEYISNAVAGVYLDKDGLHPEDFELGIEEAIAQIVSGNLSTRKPSESGVKGYGDLIRAICEYRSTVVNKETGERKFSDEEASYATVKQLVMSADKDTNDARNRVPVIVALLEKYKLERQQARVARAAGRADTAVENIDSLL